MDKKVKCKPIKGFEKLYKICSNGVVISIGKKITKNNGVEQERKERVLKPILKDGYLRVVLYKNNKPKKFYLHRLVAEYFKPNPELKKEVNHINGNKLDCSEENLEWTTRSENIKHMWDTGLRKKKGKK